MLCCSPYNGIDTMPHTQRLQILAEVWRVLRDDGWFVFSSHSIEFRNIVVAFDRSGAVHPAGTVAQSQVLSAELSSGSSLSGSRPASMRS